MSHSPQRTEHITPTDGVKTTRDEPQSTFAILSPFFYPEPISTGKYNSSLAEGLTKANMRVLAIASHPLYPSWKPEFTNASMGGVDIRRGGGWLRYPEKPILRRALLELWYTAHVTVNLLSQRSKIDAVVPVFPPSLFMLLTPFLVRRNTVKVGIVHDLQGVYAATGKGLLSRVLGRVIGVAEKRAFAACSHLVFLSETMRNVSIEQYKLDRNRTSVFYPFVNLAQSPATNQLGHLFNGPHQSVVYSGALGEKQSPEELVRLLRRILEKSETTVAKVFSQGPIFERLKSEFRHPRLAYHGLVDHQLLPELLARSDVQVIPQAPNTSDGSLPSKLPNLMAAGTRVFCLTDEGSELADIVGRYSNGAVATRWDPEHNSDAILDLLSRPKQTTPQDQTLLDRFRLEKLVAHIVSLTGKEAHAQQ